MSKKPEESDHSPVAVKPVSFTALKRPSACFTTNSAKDFATFYGMKRVLSEFLNEAKKLRGNDFL